MIENIALIVSVFSIVCSIFTMVVMLLLKKNVTDILSKDALVFDKNFELKKQAVNEALSIIDELEKFGKGIAFNEQFAARAKQCYNNLLCVANDIALVEVFHSLTMNPNFDINPQKLNAYRLLCRKDMGFEVRLTKEIMENNGLNSQPTPMYQNVAPTPQPVYQPATYNEPAKTYQEPAPVPQQEPVAEPVKTAQSTSRPEQPTQQVRRPEQTAQTTRRPTTTQTAQPVRRPTVPTSQQARPTTQRPVQRPTNPNGSNS